MRRGPEKAFSCGDYEVRFKRGKDKARKKEVEEQER